MAVEQFREVRVKTWERLVETLSVALGTLYVFRGHQRSDWTLRSSLERYSGRGLSYENEDKLLDLFKRRAHLYLPGHWIPAPDEKIGWLSLMQHHGAPTRFLDWTHSPYVAAFFALEDATEPGVDAAIWAVNSSYVTSTSQVAFWREHRKRGGAGDQLDFWEAVGRDWDDFNELWTKENEYGFDASGEDEENPDPPLTVFLAKPQRDTQRLAMQQGVLLAQANLRHSFLDNLCAPAPDKAAANIWKINIAQSVRPDALRTLRRTMNVTRETLFPGLDGFAQSLRQTLVTNPPVPPGKALAKIQQRSRRAKRLREKLLATIKVNKVSKA